jgi:3-phenylpropionate/cinnamic acid dioxygenase small subunit
VSGLILDPQALLEAFPDRETLRRKVWSVIHGVAEAAVLPPPRAQHPAMPVRYAL